MGTPRMFFEWVLEAVREKSFLEELDFIL